MAQMVCLNCGAAMELTEKCTFTGHEMREYECPKCGRSEIVDCGIALWKAISDAKRSESKDTEVG